MMAVADAGVNEFCRYGRLEVAERHRVDAGRHASVAGGLTIDETLHVRLWRPAHSRSGSRCMRCTLPPVSQRPAEQRCQVGKSADAVCRRGIEESGKEESGKEESVMLWLTGEPFASGLGTPDF